MTGRQVAVLAMRIFALFVALRGLQGVMQAIGFGADVGFAGPWAGQLFYGLTGILAGVLIWTRAEPLTALAIGGDRAREEAEPLSTLNVTDVLAIAVTIIGLYLLANAIVNAFLAVGLWIQRSALTEPAGTSIFDYGREIRRQLTWAVAGVIVGIPLVARASALSTFLVERWRKPEALAEREELGSVDPPDA